MERNHPYTQEVLLPGFAAQFQAAFPRRDVVEERSDSYLHSNDFDRKRVLGFATKLLREEVVFPPPLRTGIIVGTGGWQSALPELTPYLDLLLFLDSDPKVGEWIDETSEVFSLLQTADEYRERVYAKTNPEALSSRFPINRQDLSDEKHSYNSLYFLDSQPRYDECRTAFREFKSRGKEIVPVTMDLTNREDTQKCAAILGPKAEIVFADMTNLMMAVTGATHQRAELPRATDERRKKLEESLKNLPFTDHSVIQFSQWNSESHLQSRLVLGLEDYFDKSRYNFRL